MIELSFHGAAGCVTGFCAHLKTDAGVVLIDCGMFQGSKTLKALNYGRFPFDVSEVAAVLLTHAHIDHSGLLPKLMRAGFKGPIYATGPTRDLCAVMLADAGGIQESEVRHLNRRNERRGRDPVEPIYTREDAREVMTQFRKVRLNDPAEILPGMIATYWNAGHMLGAASIELELAAPDGAIRLLFSGDLGPGGSDYVADPEAPSGLDYLVMESTYGGRERPRLDGAQRRATLAEELVEAKAAGGPLLIPSFAVERSQELLADLLTLMEEGRAPVADIFLDSPLAIEATEVFQKHGWNRSTGRNPFSELHASTRLRFTRTPQDSDNLERLSGWHIIMASSGMCDAGRIRKHLKRLLWRRTVTVLLCGYQASGTLGRILQEGARRVSIEGEQIQVRARVRMLDVYSGHADANALTAWARERRPFRTKVLLLHGEPAARDALAKRLASGGFAAEDILQPEMDSRFTLTAAALASAAAPKPRIAAAAVSQPDWHNRRAALLLDLERALEEAPDDPARDALLQRLAETLRRGKALEETS